jgi:hypothetical protein
MYLEDKVLSEVLSFRMGKQNLNLPLWLDSKSCYKVLEFSVEVKQKSQNWPLIPLLPWSKLPY